MYHTPGAGKSIVRDAMRGEDGDTMGELNPLDVKFFRHGGIHIFMPITDDVACRRCLLFLRDEITSLLAQIDRLPTRRSKQLLAQSTLQKWSQSFKRLVKQNGKRYHGLD